MKIYVMTHKKFEPPEEGIYVPLQVGRALASDLGYLSDNTGENISDLNSLFGELTGIYWIWQNDVESDYIGVCHYRRYYLDEKEENILNEEQFKSILSEYDCITSDLLVSKKPNYDNYCSTHPSRDLDIIRDSVIKLYPEYERAYDDYMRDFSSCYSNLCVMPRQMFGDYCSWLFSILFDASESIDVSDYDLYQRRVYGFLSEMLLDVYVRHNGFNVKRNPVGTFGDKAETNELCAAVNVLIGQGSYKEARALCQEIISLRPDIMLPMSDSKRRIPIVDHLTCILDLEADSGTKGLSKVSLKLDDLIDYYRKVHDILSKKADEGDVEFLKESSFSPYAAVVMTINDISRGILAKPIDEKEADNTLRKAFSGDDYKLYVKLKNKFK